MGEWTETYFENAYLRRWALRPPGAGERQLAVRLVDLLEQTPPARIAEIGCGHGRYATPLGELGFKVVGFDASRALLHLAIRLSNEAHSTAKFVLADMRSLPSRGPFDGAILLDSFGFFSSPEEDRKALQQIRGLLRAGSRLVMKVVNGGLIRDNFRSSDRSEREGTIETIERELLNGGAVMRETLTIEDTAGIVESRRQQRLYDREMLVSTLNESGFSTHIFGGFEREPASRDSHYFVVVARRA